MRTLHGFMFRNTAIAQPFTSIGDSPMSAQLPPRWYRDVSTGQDILDLAEHIAAVCQLPQKDRAFRGGIQVKGDAYLLVRVVLEEQRADLVRRLINVFVNPYGAYAKELGGLFFAAFKKYDGSVTARLKYVLAHYSQVEDDTGHSCTLNHYDAMQMDNPYWESPDYY